MRIETKKISGIERVSCWKNEDTEADELPNIVIESSGVSSHWFIKQCRGVNQSTNWTQLNTKEAALKIAEIYIDDMKVVNNESEI
jgi:hypothetical protein